jgi:hypothetical protein
MKTNRPFRNPDCARRTRLARIQHRLDWLNRFEDTTEVPSTGALSLGEIAVQDSRLGEHSRALSASGYSASTFRLTGPACCFFICHCSAVMWSARSEVVVGPASYRRHRAEVLPNDRGTKAARPTSASNRLGIREQDRIGYEFRVDQDL